MQVGGTKPSNVQEIINHLDDVEYPVTGREFMEACNNMSDVTKEQKDWTQRNINMDKKYNSPEEIKRDLKL